MSPMMTRSKVVVAVVAVGIAAAVVVGIALRVELRCAGFAGPGVTAADLPPANDDPGLLRLVAWNIRNFPLDERPDEPGLGHSRRTNICDLQDVLGGLDADLMLLTEIRDTRRFPPILRRSGHLRPYREVHSQIGGGGSQYLVLVWDSERLERLGDPIELFDLSLEGRFRPGFGGRFRSRTEGGVDFTVLGVHLAAGRKGYDERLLQYALLARWAEEERRLRGDDDLVILGDFNTAGSPDGTPAEEIALLDGILGAVGLRRLVNPLGCTQYWEGPGPRDGVQVAAELDLVYVGGFPAVGPETEVRPWLHCARTGCGTELVSGVGAEDGTFWDVSDHCPITFEVAAAP